MGFLRTNTQGLRRKVNVSAQASIAALRATIPPARLLLPGAMGAQEKELSRFGILDRNMTKILP